MTQLFTASEYAQIHSLVFRDGYPGYTPNVVESPNGDGKLDTEERKNWGRYENKALIA